MGDYQVMPPLAVEDFAALKADIEARGVLVPVEYDEDGKILDGHHRVQACEELGIADWPRFIRKGMTEEEKRAHARQLNLARRHLNREQKRDLIKAQLIETPDRSNRQLAEGLGVDHKTVQAVRSEAEGTGEIPQLEKTTGADGKERRKPVRTAYVDPTPEGKQEALAVAKDVRKEALKVRGTQGTGENEWYTPKKYIDAAIHVMGGIDLDPASSNKANAVVRAASIFTEDEDGLKREWFGRVWMNPPYAQPLIANFTAKVRSEFEEGRINQAIILTHNYTDTAWFHNLQGCSSSICFTRGRVKFESPAGDVAAPTQGQAFFHLSRKSCEQERFRQEFSRFGFVVAAA